MKHLLHNPVYHALCSGDRHFGFGTDAVKFFDEAVSPFVGFADGYTNGFNDLYDLLPRGRRILYASPGVMAGPAGWELKHEIKGLQFVYDQGIEANNEFTRVRPLGEKDIDQMMQLAAITKPGPFGQRTISFGNYYGIFENEELVAMTGQRLHVQHYTEISAVCTHPNHTGKGYANTLMQHQVQLILQQGQHPFLHVREDNERAVALYKRLGFAISRQMNFYFMKRL